jgi:hypothetical protein
MQTVPHPHHQGQDRILPQPQKAPLAFEPEAFLKVGILFVQDHVPQMLDRDHMLVTFFRIFIRKVVSIVHGSPPRSVIFLFCFISYHRQTIPTSRK